MDNELIQFKKQQDELFKTMETLDRDAYAKNSLINRYIVLKHPRNEEDEYFSIISINKEKKEVTLKKVDIEQFDNLSEKTITMDLQEVQTKLSVRDSLFQNKNTFFKKNKF